MQIKSGLAVYPNCSDPGILALLIEYHGDVETGILDIESDADNMACQGIPITKGWPKLFMGKKKHLQNSCRSSRTKGKKLEEKNTSNIPCQQNRPKKYSKSHLSVRAQLAHAWDCKEATSKSKSDMARSSHPAPTPGVRPPIVSCSKFWMQMKVSWLLQRRNQVDDPDKSHESS